jgi:hypothetical protein
MRLRRSDSEDEAPPSRGPVAAYAGVLDGRHLWLAIHAMPGTLFLRDAGNGDLLALQADPTEDPDYVSVRVDLTELVPGPGQGGSAAYDVVLKTSRLMPAKAVWAPPLPAREPMRVPPAPDGVTQFAIDRTDDGHLRVLRDPLPAAAELVSIERREQSVHLTVRPPGAVEPGTHLLLLDPDDRVLDALAVTGHDGLLEALVGVDELPAGWFGVVRFAVGTPESWVRIRRRNSDLADPNHAVLLPELYDDDPDQPRARFRWSPDSLLAMRVIDPDEAATGTNVEALPR